MQPAAQMVAAHQICVVFVIASKQAHGAAGAIPVHFVHAALAPVPEGGKLWVLLVAGSSGYMNYRHQADVCHAYQVCASVPRNRHAGRQKDIASVYTHTHTYTSSPALDGPRARAMSQMMHARGVPDEQIVVMLYDDVVKSFFNTRKGAMYNEPNGPDVYAGVPKDYTNKQITPKNFLAVLSGDTAAMAKVPGSGRVINSGPNDRIFVYFADHGAPGMLAFPSRFVVVPTKLMAHQLIGTIEAMHANRRFHQVPAPALYTTPPTYQLTHPHTHTHTHTRARARG